MRQISRTVVATMFVAMIFAVGGVYADEPTSSLSAVQVENLSVETELADIQKLAKELDRRVQRLEALILYQQAVEARNQSLKDWRALKVQSETATDRKDKEARAEERFFQQRELAQQHLETFHRLSQ